MMTKSFHLYFSFIPSLFISFSNANALDEIPIINWSQPPVACIEEFYQKVDRACPDLSPLKDPVREKPVYLPEDEFQFWTVSHKSALSVCRAQEVNRREKISPGSTGWAEWAWMKLSSQSNQENKILEIYNQSEKTGVPPQILYAALQQESVLADLGISEDGGNYSCGIGQINLQEWCRAAQSLQSTEQKQIQWPFEISCDDQSLPTSLLKPYYQIAIQKLGEKPLYLLSKQEFEAISLKDVIASFPKGNEAIQLKRHQAVLSFISNCSQYQYGIFAKAHELKYIFNSQIPKGLRETQRYLNNETFQKSCIRPYTQNVYPLHIGWLMAVGIYNAGSAVPALFGFYEKLTDKNFLQPEKMAQFSPLDLVEAFYFGGKANVKKDRTEFLDPVTGNLKTMSWYKQCVLQRHLSRVINYAAQPGLELSHSYDETPCAKGNIPLERQKTTGVKDSLFRSE